MHFLLGGIGGIASQVSEVLYAGDIDVAGGNLYPVFVTEYKHVVVSLCRVGSDDGHLQIGDVGNGNRNVFGDVLRVSRGIYFNIPFDKRGHFPFHNAVAHIVFFAYNGNVRGSAATRREQHCQNKQVQ